MAFLQFILILMLNTKRNFNNNVYNGSKSRSKSIYRGDQSHTLSMHIRIDNQVSPDKIKIMPDLQLHHKYSHKENKIQAFRQSLRMNEPIHLGKKTQRQDLQTKSSKKLTTLTTLETQRPLKQSMNASYRKSSRQQKIAHPIQITTGKQKSESGKQNSSDHIAINVDQLKSILATMKKLAQQNSLMKKQLMFLSKNKSGSTVSKALLR